MLSVLCKNIGYAHQTAQSSGVDPKAFEKLYSQDQAISMGTPGPRVQQVFMAPSQSTPTDLESQTQTQAQHLDFPKEVGLTGASGKEDGGANTLMDVEL